jgi:hypothetical protein
VEIAVENLGFGSRLWMAFVLPFKVLFDGAFAAAVARLESSPALLSAPSEPKAASAETAPAKQGEGAKSDAETKAPPVEPDVDTTAALQLLSILQREGRFIDFVQEDMSGFGDAEIGAAARVVQEGCKRALSEYVDVSAVRGEAEGAKVTLEVGYDAHATRVTGNVTGKPPYAGVLAHHGWRVTRIVLPRLSESHDPRVLAPAEVEVGA